MKVVTVGIPIMFIALFGLSGCSREAAPAAPGGVYRSESAGALFEQSVNVVGEEGAYISQFSLQSVHRPAHEKNTVYIAAGERGIVVSKDDGVSWHVITTPLTFATDIVVLPSGVMVAAGRDGSGQGYVVRSLDQGVSWQSVFTIPVPVDEKGFQIVGGGTVRPSVVLNLEVDPFNPGRIYGGSSLGSLFIGEQDAKTWRAFYTLKVTNPLITSGEQPGITKVIASPHAAGELLIITDTKRLLRIKNGTQENIPVPRVLGQLEGPFANAGERNVLDVSFVQGFPQALIVGVDDGAVVTRDLGESWVELSVPAETSEVFNTVVVRTSPTNANRIFVAINGVVYRSEDGGSSWNTFSFGLSGFAITDLSINPENAATVLAIVRQLQV